LASPVNRLLTSSVCDEKEGLDSSRWLGHIMRVGGCVLVLFLVACSVCFIKECSAISISAVRDVRSGGEI
jgi:hypothetical protein